MSEDLFSTFDSVVKDLGSWLKSVGFEGRGRRGFTLAYPNGWHLLLGSHTSQHDRRANEVYWIALRAYLEEEGGTVRWWWSSTLDRPGQRRPHIDRRWQKLDPETSPDEFRSSLQSAINALAGVKDRGWNALTKETDPIVLVPPAPMCLLETWCRR